MDETTGFEIVATTQAPEPAAVKLDYLISLDEGRVVDYWMLTSDIDAVATKTGLPAAEVRAILRQPKVKREIQRRMDLSSVSASETSHHIAEIVRFNPAKFALCYTKNDKGKRQVDLAMVEELGLGRFIERIDTDAFGHECIRWYSRAKGLELLTKVNGMTRELHQHTLTVEDVRRLSDDDLRKQIADMNQ
jgi:hypothetical protein